LKPEHWIGLVQWLVSHMDKVAVEQWEWQGQSQIEAEAKLEAGEVEDDVEVGAATDTARVQWLTGGYEDVVNALVALVESVDNEVPYDMD
jgi:hypothetical protein